MNVIPKDKTQLLSLLNKQPSITVLALHQGSPAQVAQQLQTLKQPQVTVIVMKS
jgi:hypothetical protein